MYHSQEGEDRLTMSAGSIIYVVHHLWYHMLYMQGMATDTLEKTLEEQFLQFLLEQGKKVACKYSYTVL